MYKSGNTTKTIVESNALPSYAVGDKVVLLLSTQKIVGIGADGIPITEKALLFCLEPQTGRRIEDSVLKSPGGKIEEGIGIYKTAILELKEELGICIDNEISLRYIESINSEYAGIVKQLHLVLCDRSGKTINIDNQYSQKKLILGDDGEEKEVNEILRNVWLTRQELIELKLSQEALSKHERNDHFVTNQVTDLIPTLIDNRELL